MKKGLKITLGIVGIIIVCLVLDIVNIFVFNKPIFAIKGKQPYMYIGLFYDTYTCLEYSVPQVKLKGTKFSCAVGNVNTKK